MKNYLTYAKTGANEFKRLFALRIRVIQAAMFAIIAFIMIAPLSIVLALFIAGGAIAMSFMPHLGNILGLNAAGGPDDEDVEVTKARNKMQDEIKSAINKAVTEKNKPLEDALKELQESLKNGITKKMYDDLVAEIAAKGLEIKELQENPKGKGAKKSLTEVVKENFKEIQKISKGVKDGEEVILKDIANVNIPSGTPTITDNQQAYFLPDIGQLATRKVSAYEVFPKLNIGSGNHQGRITYYDWDAATIARAAAVVKEGKKFPQSTAKFKRYSIDLIKIGDTLPVTDEFMNDEVIFAAEFEQFLRINMALEKDRQIVLGVSASGEIAGLKETFPVYAYVAGETQYQDANIWDLFLNLQSKITKVGGAKYRPDFALMNVNTINKMMGKKSSFNTYLQAPFVSNDGKNVAGVTVIECNTVEDNTMYFGDRRFAKIYEIGGYELQKGYAVQTVDGVSVSQFQVDEITLKVRERLQFLIRNADLGGFLQVTDIDAALLAITAPTAP